MLKIKAIKEEFEGKRYKGLLRRGMESFGNAVERLYLKEKKSKYRLILRLTGHAS